MEGITYTVCKNILINNESFDTKLERINFEKNKKRFNQRKKSEYFIADDSFKFHFFKDKFMLEFNAYYKLKYSLYDKSLEEYTNLTTLREIDKFTLSIYKDCASFGWKVPSELENLVIISLRDGMPVKTRLITPSDIDYFDEEFLTNRICSLVETNKLGIDKLILSLSGENIADVRESLFHIRNEQYIYELCMRESKSYDSEKFLSKVKDTIKSLFKDKDGNHMYDSVRAAAIYVSDLDKRIELKRIEEENQNIQNQQQINIYSGKQIGIFDVDSDIKKR